MYLKITIIKFNSYQEVKHRRRAGDAARTFYPASF